MSFFIFLTVVQTIVAAGLVGVILMQRSEGGGLGIGGSPGGLMGARGAADFLTRTTRWLAILFVALSITLAAVAVETSGRSEISTTLDRTAAPAAADLSIVRAASRERVCHYGYISVGAESLKKKTNTNNK